MQNPNPLTFTRLSALLDGCNADRAGLPAPKLKLRDVLPDLSAPQVRSRRAEDACTGFSARRAAIGLCEVLYED